MSSGRADEPPADRLAVLSQAADDLASDTRRIRTAATDRLAAAGLSALPVLVDRLSDPVDQADAPAELRRRQILHHLAGQLGRDGREAAIAWLSSEDIDHWAGAISVLAATERTLARRGSTAPGSIDARAAVVGLAVGTGLPPAVQRSAQDLLNWLAVRDAVAAADRPNPSADDLSSATATLVDCLDRILSPEGLPEPDRLLNPDPQAITPQPTVDRFIWDPASRCPVRRPLPPTAARAIAAIHAARDLEALGATEPAAVLLVLLARLETLTAFADDRQAALDAVAAEQLAAALSGPDGLSVDRLGDLLDEALRRELVHSAAAVARGIDLACEADRSRNPDHSLPPAVRAALVRGLAVPGADLQFAAARTLARQAGASGYPGASLMVKTLIHAASAGGRDRAVVAHPDQAVAAQIAASLARHGYVARPVSSGRDCIFAARDCIDTRLIFLAARATHPTAIETVQLLKRPAHGDVPAIFVVVDPLDDTRHGRFLTRLMLTFRDHSGVAIVDRLDSFFAAAINPESDAVVPARFPAVLAGLSPGPVDPPSRQAAAGRRLANATEALALLAACGQQGVDVSEAVPLATAAALRPEATTAALGVLAIACRPAAQRAIVDLALTPGLDASRRQTALAALAESRGRSGILLTVPDLFALEGMYTAGGSVASDPALRATAAAIIDQFAAPASRPPAFHAPEPESAH
jgi:hypothetical protein